MAAVMVPVGGAAGPVQKGPDAIACPAAPQGWNHPAVAKTVSTPQTTSGGYGSNYEQVAGGGNAVTVTCEYHNTSVKQVYVAVSFALPSDLNPLNDFDLGCSRGDVNWNSSDRVYRVSSPDQWALATLVDDRASLRTNDVPAFQRVTRGLLQNAKGYGHSCVVTPRPTELRARFYFDIRAGGDNIKATFWSPPSPSKSGIYSINEITPVTAALQVNTKVGVRVLKIRFTRGIDYRLQTAKLPARVRFGVSVAASKIPSCRTGATGTLTISTPLSVVVDVCGQSFSPVVTSLVRIYTR